MAENIKEGAIFVAGGAAVGVGVSTTVGGMGLTAGGTAVGVGMVPVTAIGMVTGAAAYGAFKAIETGDNTALGAVAVGAIGGAGISNAIGGMGLVAPKIGLAFGIGALPIATAGAVVGLAAYGVHKMLNREDVRNNTYRNLQTLAEITREYEEKRFWTSFEIEEELQALKAELDEKTNLNCNPTSPFSPVLEAVFSEKSTTKILSIENKVTEHQKASEKLSIEPQPPQTWSCRKILKGHTAAVNTLALSPDAGILASGSDDRTVKLWNLKTGEWLYSFYGQAEAVLSVAISSDGKILASGSADRKITSWQIDTRKLFHSFRYLNVPQYGSVKVTNHVN